MDGITGKRVLVTGAFGFLGMEVVHQLLNRGDCEVQTFSRYTCDLTSETDTAEMMHALKPETVIHLAASCGGIGINQQEPGRFFYENMQMGLNIMEQSRLNGVEKFVQVGTVCSYPKFCPTPFKEEDLWNGYPEETNAPYGIAKKALLTMAQAYRQQYGFNAIYLIPVNLYGPGDNFDPSSSHVIPAIIKKMVYAREMGINGITLWGTGKATREFLYVKDAAEGIIAATEKYDKASPVNLGNGMTLDIHTLASILQSVTKFNGRIFWDITKPDGQPLRQLDVRKAKEEFGWQAKTSFLDGLKETVEWYENSCVNQFV